MFGLEEYYDDLLLEAKSPEEIKKILEYQFVQGKGVPRHVFVDIFNMDPTKKKSYTRWVLMQYEKYHEEICKALIDGRLERMFQTFKDRAGKGLDLTNIESFPKALEYVPDVDPCLTKEGDENLPENDFDVVYETPEWVVAVPHTYEANRKLGRGCRWCTAGAFGDNDYYWNRYSPSGPIFVNFDKRHSEVGPMDNKEYPYTRYQFLFEWQNWAGELMNSEDRRVDFDNINMPEDVVEFYGEENPKYREMIENNGGGSQEDRWSDYNDERWDCSMNVLNINERWYLTLMPEQNDDMDLNVEYMLYDEDDTSDPIFSEYFDKDDYYICGSADGKAALLKNSRGNPVLVFWEASNSRWSSGSFDIARIDDWWALRDLIVAVDGSYAFFMPKNESNTYNEDAFTRVECDALSNDESIDSVFINEQISKFANDNGIEGYYGTVIEAVLHNKSHSLFMYDGGNVIPMIVGDTPTNGECFIAEMDGDMILIRGTRFTHKFGEGGEADSGNMSLYSEIGEVNGHEYCIVKIGGEELFSLYDITDRKVMFHDVYSKIKEVYSYSSENIYLICTEQYGDNSLVNLYDIQKNAFVLKGCSNIIDLFKYKRISGVFFAALYEKQKMKIISLKNEFKVVGEVWSIAKQLCSNDQTGYCIIKDDDGYNVMNLENGKLMINDNGFVNFGVMENMESVLCFLQKQEQVGSNVVNIYNYVEGKLVFENYDITGGRPTELYKTSSGSAWKIKKDGKYNIMTNDGTFILPKFVDIISSKPTEQYNMIPIIDGDKFWLLSRNMKLLPTRDGVDLTTFSFKTFGYLNRPIFRYKNMEVTLNDKSIDTVEPLISPFEGSYDEGVEKEICSLLFKKQAEIRESFNKTLNMLNNFYKDKD